ncbi:MAG TPA: hypothetical protein VF559_01025 [Caulobacteraceae bacterium]|jgi:hypothetical protein
MIPLAQALRTQPGIFAHDYQPAADAVSFVRLSEAEIAEASFLDSRTLTPGRPAEARPFAEAEAAAAGLPEQLGFIFHIGHVGSTLLSRLLGRHHGVLSLREPQAFRTLAALHLERERPESLFTPAEFDRRLSLFLRLWSRPFRSGQLPLVKATSGCGALAADVLTRPSEPRAIFMTVKAEPFLATILGGENNPVDIRGHAPARLRRLHARLGEPRFRLSEMSLGEMTAMSWASETAALSAAAEAAPGQSLWLDFDQFLQAPAEHLSRVLRHLGREATAAEAAALAASPDLGRYAKAPEHAYDAALRAAVLDQARARRGDEIAQGMAWLERLRTDSPDLLRSAT